MSEEKEMESCECRHTQRTEKERKILMTRLKTVEGQIRGIEKMVENDAYCPDIVMQVSAVTNALNSPSVTAEEAPRLAPFIALAGKLGVFAGQMVDFGVLSIDIAYEGEVSKLNAKPLTAAALAEATGVSTADVAAYETGNTEIPVSYLYEVAKACDAGKVTRQDAAGAVLYASEQAMVQAHQAVQALGGAGFLNDSVVSRLFRDAKLMEIGAGTSEIRRMLIGRELMAGA